MLHFDRRNIFSFYCFGRLQKLTALFAIYTHVDCTDCRSCCGFYGFDADDRQFICHYRIWDIHVRFGVRCISDIFGSAEFVRDNLNEFVEVARYERVALHIANLNEELRSRIDELISDGHKPKLSYDVRSLKWRIRDRKRELAAIVDGKLRQEALRTEYCRTFENAREFQLILMT